MSIAINRNILIWLGKVRFNTFAELAFYFVVFSLVGTNIWSISPLLMFALGFLGYVALIIGWIRVREHYGIEDE